jgi:hypothetical protein
MVLDDELAAAIGAQVRVAVLSAETYAKQRGLVQGKDGHPELTLEDYRSLPRLAADPDLVIQEDGQNLILIRSADGKWLVAVVKATATGKALFVTSVRTQRDQGVLALLKKGTVLVDRR